MKKTLQCKYVVSRWNASIMHNRLPLGRQGRGMLGIGGGEGRGDFFCYDCIWFLLE